MNNVPETHWALGTVVWLPIRAVLVIALVVVGIYCRRKYYSGTLDSYDESPVGWIGIGCYVVVFLLIGLTFWGMYPYKAEYHQWQPHGGEVAKIDKRILSAGDGMEEKFVVVFEGDKQQYGCQDTRCATVRPGDTLWLGCKKKFEWAATDGFDCRFISYESE